MYSAIIIGAGLYGLYAALYCAKKSRANSTKKVLVLEKDSASFQRATYINQARVHMGYHYPRSLSTASKSSHYFQRFMEDYGFCVLTDFDQIYATSSNFSWTNAQEFKKFCKNANIRCDEVDPNKYFNPDMCDGAFLTEEYTYDARILQQHILQELSGYPNVDLLYESAVLSIDKKKDHFVLKTSAGTFTTDFLLNATYASTNEIITMLQEDPFKIKYELCEIILCKVNDSFKNTGLTVMDGPFFSIMPFGKTGYHSLTSVTFTPHVTSYGILPAFPCQQQENGEASCSPEHLANCNECPQKPHSAWPYMSSLTRKYLREEYQFYYSRSLYSMKPILMASEIDDSRPTVIKRFSRSPTFISVLSGKINTVYDLDEVLDNEYV
jgi:hypothetical protein